MAHLTSSAALHAARIVLRHYAIESRPASELPSGAIHNIQPTEKHLAILIDYGSNAFEVVTVRPEFRYWQKRLRIGSATAPQLGNFISKVIVALEKLPRYQHEEEAEKVSYDLPNGIRPWSQMTLSRLAIECTKLVLTYYRAAPRKEDVPRDIDSTRLTIAKYIDVSLGLRHAIRALPLLRACNAGLRQGKLTEAEIIEYFREIGVFLGMMPSYADREDEVKLLA